MISIIHLLVFTFINFIFIQDNTKPSEIKKRVIISLLGYSIGILLSNRQSTIKSKQKGSENY